ncbi:ABC transporter transmembrane domain-containing protein [Streptomyces cyaneus]|uniref:ABC transporter transmembrane domain-containing protein n=1 Tax=Streptomyces cyaneus TaxID=1904 RepID=UPI003CCC4BFF
MREVRDAFRRFWPLTRGDREWLAAIVACVVVAAPAETASILLFAELTDNALKAGSLSAFWGPAAAWLGVAALGALVGYLGNSLATWTAERFVLRLRAKVFRHVQDLPPHFFQKHRQGDLVERLTAPVPPGRPPLLRPYPHRFPGRAGGRRRGRWRSRRSFSGFDRRGVTRGAAWQSARPSRCPGMLGSN